MDEPYDIFETPREEECEFDEFEEYAYDEDVWSEDENQEPT